LNYILQDKKYSFIREGIFICGYFKS
jgi:hypothetical protein